MITQTLININDDYTHALVESKRGNIYPVELSNRMKHFYLQKGDKVQIRVRNGNWMLVGVVLE